MKNLAEVVVNMYEFFELTPAERLDADLSVQGLEMLVSLVQSASPAEKAAIRDVIMSRISSLNEYRDAAERRNLYENIAYDLE